MLKNLQSHPETSSYTGESYVTSIGANDLGDETSSDVQPLSCYFDETRGIKSFRVALVFGKSCEVL